MAMTPNSTYEIISYYKLLEAIENDLAENNFKTSSEFLDSAVTDWPIFDLFEPADLLAELRKEVSGSLTYINLDYYSKRLDLDIGLNLWKVEAISSLLEMFDFERNNIFDKNIELENIIEKITKHYSKS